jgi:hypothetical protein
LLRSLRSAEWRDGGSSGLPRHRQTRR